MDTGRLCITTAKLFGLALTFTVLTVAHGQTDETKGQSGGRIYVYEHSRNGIWASHKIFDAVRLAENHLRNELPGRISPVRDVLVFTVDDEIYVKLGKFDPNAGTEDEMLESALESSAYFKFDATTLKLLNFDICRHECGIFGVRWFKIAEFDSRN